MVLARSGAGKSYLVKLDVLRNLYQGVQVAVIDPDDEYAPLTEHVGGTLIRLGAPGVHVNPFDLPAGDTRPDALTRRGLFLHTLISVMLTGSPTPTQKAALDRAVTTTYLAAGITTDPTTWTRPAPQLADLAAVLAADEDPAARALAAELHPWTHGTFADLFAVPTTPTSTASTASTTGTASTASTTGTASTASTTGTAAPFASSNTTGTGAPLCVWSLRHLPDELRAVGTLVALDAIWAATDQPGSDPNIRGGVPTAARRRLIVVDEAWTLLRDGEGAKFLYRMAKAARKRCAGLTVVTQDAADVLGTDLGLAVVSNAATQILMRQAPQAIDAVQAAFALTATEARMLLAAPQGEVLLVGGTVRLPFRSVASPKEAVVVQTGIGGRR